MHSPPCWPTTRDGRRPAVPVRCGYARLQRGGTVVLVDAGATPPLELAGAACAGCLSFELSTGAELLLVNGGTPGADEAGRRAVARATASHTTLCLGEQSSAKLMRDARLEREIGSAPLRHPDRVACEVREGEGGAIALEASHDGYAERFGLVHTPHAETRCRRHAAGGLDRLAPPRASCASPGTCLSPSISTCPPTARRASGHRRRPPSCSCRTASIGA